MNVLVSDVMIKSAVFCRPDFNLAEVAAIMWDEGVGVLPVVNEAEDVTGIITDRDVCIALGTRNVNASAVAVRDVAPARYFGCSASDEIHSALKTMASQAVRRLPVVDEGGRLSGILSIDDIILHAGDRPGIDPLAVLTALRAICGHRSMPHGEIIAVAA